jgi:hypothetical protein
MDRACSQNGSGFKMVTVNLQKRDGLGVEERANVRMGLKESASPLSEIFFY